VKFTLAPNCKVELADKGEVDLAYLRPGDKVQVTHDSPDQPLPAEVVSGKEPLIILGAIAGG